MDGMNNKRICKICGELSSSCSPTCLSCTSDRAMVQRHYKDLKRIAVRLVRWADEYESTWKDDSDGEVAFEAIVDDAYDLVFKEMAE